MNIRVLLVDTNDEARASLGERLRRTEGLELLGPARDNAEAAGILNGSQPDVVLLDLHGPDGRWGQVCRDLRSLVSAPVTVLTSFMTQERWKALQAAGASQFFLKRVNSEEFGRALVEVGRCHRAQTAAKGTRP